MTTAQILFLRPDGSATKDPPDDARLIPVVRVALPHTIDENSRCYWGANGGPERTCWALIDTGADNNYIDTEFAKDLEIAAIPGVKWNVQGATGSRESTMHNAPLMLLDSRFLLLTDLIATPLKENGRAYPLVLGMSFLRLGRLLMDFDKSRFEFRKL